MTDNFAWPRPSVSILALCGPSGCGKTVLEEKLVRGCPRAFSKLPQVTTRAPRPSERQFNPYFFVSKEQYDTIRDCGFLICKVPMSEKFKASYGTIPLLNPNKVNTAIVSADGLRDMMYLEESMDGIVKLFVAYIDVYNPRDGRDVQAEIAALEDELLRAARFGRYRTTVRKFVPLPGEAFVSPKSVAREVCMAGLGPPGRWQFSNKILSLIEERVSSG